MIIVFALLIFVFLAIESVRAARNETAQLQRGGIEATGDVYPLMRVAYPAAFAAMLVEALIRGLPSPPWIGAGLVLFFAGKAVKWWAILTLGPSWTFRVIVVPGMGIVKRGPYRYLRHPNYVGVVGELAGTALVTGAAVSGPVACVLFGVLLRKRIEVEERLLDSTARHPPCSL